MVSVTILTLVLLICMVSRTRSCGPNLPGLKSQKDLYVIKRQPDVAEDSKRASGKFEHAVKRNDTRLKRISTTQIVFAHKEFDAKCRLATKRCKESLLRLADVVETHWSKEYKLMVLHAYIEPKDVKHVFKESSLHLEGRAFDLKLIEAPGTRLKRRSMRRIALNLPTLAGLAYYEAQFSFVEVKPHHIHVSCPKKERKIRKGSHSEKLRQYLGRCFPANAYVRREDGEQILIKNVKIGDKLLTLNHQGSPIYSEVNMMMHRQPNVVVKDYVKISTEAGKTIVLSLHHLIAISNINSSTQQFIFGKDIIPRHHHILTYDEKGGVARSRVLSKEYATELGAFAPLTMEGTLVVNDVYASCYSEFPSHMISHHVFIVWRTIYSYLSPLLDFQSSADGIHWYPDFFRWVLNMLPILSYEV